MDLWTYNYWLIINYMQLTFNDIFKLPPIIFSSKFNMYINIESSVSKNL